MFKLTIGEPQPFDSLLSLKGKVAVVTGGSRGIGRQILNRFAEAGAKTVFTGRGQEALTQTEAELRNAGAEATGIRADVKSIEDSRRVVQTAIEKYGRLDILVNNAAGFPFISAMEMTEDAWDNTFDTDAKGTFFMAKLAAGAMIKCGNGGRIINFMSTAALNPTSPLIAYGAAKNAVWYITRTLAQELAPYHITVNAATPGATMTQERIDAFGGGNVSEFLEKSGNAGLSFGRNIVDGVGSGAMLDKFGTLLGQAMPTGRTGYPDDLAKAVLFLAGDMAEYITGVNIVVDGGQSLQNPMFNAVKSLQGQPEEPAAQPEDKAQPTDGNPDGRWKAELNTPFGKNDIVFDYKTEGNVLTGTVTLMGNTANVLNGTVSGNTFSHAYMMKSPMGKVTVQVGGRAENDKLTGSIKIAGKSLNFEAVRM